MSELPASPNLYCCLHTDLAKAQLAELFRPLATNIRKCGRDEHEVFLPWAEFVIEGESPILLHGSVADVLTHAERILAVLRDAGVHYSAESYGEHGETLRTVEWKANFTVHRQDDNGNRFVVETGLSREDAERMAAELERRGHKQLYWVEAG